MTLTTRTGKGSPLSNAEIDANWAHVSDRANHVGTQTAATISDFAEAAQDAAGALLVAGTGIALSYNDAANTLTVAATGGGGGGTTDPEVVRDTVAAALVGAGLVAVAADDAADTITISTTATANATDAQLRDRATHTGSQAAATISDFTEAAQDAVGALLVAGAGISLAYNDAGNTLTVTATGGGGTTYTLPAATAAALGGVKDGTGVTVAGDGTLSVDYGSVAGTAAQGNDARITGAAQKNANLSDLASAATALANLGAAPLASPPLTGIPTAPTAAAGTNTTQIATMAALQAAVAPAANPQFAVAASGSLALVLATHQNSTVVLGGTGATLTINATSLGDGFACKIINDSGADWTVPAPTGGTLRFDNAGYTRIVAGGSGGLETYTRGGTRYVHVTGTTA